MSISQGVMTAAGVVGVGALAAVTYAQVQKGRALGQGTKAARDLAAAGGDPNAVNTLIDVLRGAGGAAGGAAGAAEGALSNENSGEYAAVILASARAAMAKAGRPSQLGRNLRVVRPLDKSSQWRIGEGCWLPSEGAEQGWRTEPQSLVRGLDMSYALTYLPDVYPAPAGSGSVVAYPAKWGYHRTGPLRRATDAGIAHAYDVMITSTAQGGGSVALWDPSTLEFVSEGERVIFAIQWPAGRAPVALSLGSAEADSRFGRGAYGLDSSFLPELATALQNRPIFRPFPRRRLQSKR